jgi:hypothetical protein
MRGSVSLACSSKLIRQKGKNVATSMAPLSLTLTMFLIAGCASMKSSEEREEFSSQTCRKGINCKEDAGSPSIEVPQQTEVHQKEIVSTSNDERELGQATGITILDAAFTDRIVNRQPENRITSWRLKDAGARAWLWVKVRCSGPCQRKLTSQGKVQLTFHWFKETDKGFVKKYSASLPVKGHEWRTWAVKSNLEPGKWKVTILSDRGRVCLDQQSKCEFLLDLTQ